MWGLIIAGAAALVLLLGLGRADAGLGGGGPLGLTLGFGQGLSDGVRLAMQALVSLGFGAYALWTLFRPDASAGEKQAAIGFGGTILGFWLSKASR